MVAAFPLRDQRLPKTCFPFRQDDSNHSEEPSLTHACLVVSFANMKSALRRSQKGERPVLVIAANLTQAAARHLKETMDRWIHYTKMRHFQVNYPFTEADQPSDVNFQFLQWHRFNLRTVVFGEEHQVDLSMVYKILQSCEGLEKANFMALTNRRNHTSADLWVHSITVNRPNLVSLTMRGAHEPGRRPLTCSIPVGPNASRNFRPKTLTYG
jgi:hypothetical protein